MISGSKCKYVTFTLYHFNQISHVLNIIGMGEKGAGRKGRETDDHDI